MAPLENTAFARYLIKPDITENTAQLAQVWCDQTVTYRLSGGARMAKPGLGGHLRRSFLGALARGASSAAQQNKPCPWDPPCALDVFLREQFRGARGDGLPKPYVIFTDTSGDDLLVFGVANDWFNTAAEAILIGMREILPCQRLFGCDLPPVPERKVELVSGLFVPEGGASVSVEFLTPVDSQGKAGPPEPSLLSRLLRRVDGLARWQGLALSANHARDLARLIGELDYQQSRLVRDMYCSPNRKSQQRRHKTMKGVLVATGSVGPILAIGERCHIGRAAIEGLGRYKLVI